LPKKHLTPAGFARYEQEWKELKFIERPTLIEKIAEAAAQGDRSENADYIYGKIRLREIDRRLRKIDQILDQSEVVEKVANDGKIHFGAQVQLKNNSNGTMQVYQLVGPAETDPVAGKISFQSPLGAALKDRVAGEVISVQTPRGVAEYTIESFSYE